jgi:hypothetical protein
MITPHKIKIPRQSDRVLIDTFSGLAQNHDSKEAIRITLGSAGTQELKINEDLPTALKKAHELNLSIITTISTVISGFGVSYSRGGTQEPASAVFDEISFNFNQQHCKLSELQRVGIIGDLSNALGAFEPQRTVSGILTQDQQNLLAIHSSTLERLEHLNEELIRGSEEFRRNAEKDFQERSDKLEEKFNERTAALNTGIDKQREELSKKRDELAQRTREIDDRQNTHVRREIRKDILGEIQKRTEEFKLTKGTNRLRWPVHIISAVLLLSLGAANIIYGIELTNLIEKGGTDNTLALSILASKQALLSIAFGATAVFYIRWLTAWSREHASTEFALKKFQLDIERASWVVETALEWKDTKDSTIPSELLEPISRNLFLDSSEPINDLHPADELASALLGTASKVRIRAGDSELEYNNRDIKKAGKQ